MCVPIEDIMSRKRNKPTALARQVAMYFVHKTGNSMEETGRMFDRHHSNIVHAVRCVTNWRECDWEVKKIVKQVENAIPELKRVHNIDFQI
jgi:chromosomal replication initiation ATPase DnaA